MTLLTLLPFLAGDAHYLGCIADTGHTLLTEELGSRFDFSERRALSVEHQIEGVAKVHHLGGWTALAFWDRSVDSRPGSNSVFIFRGELTFDAAVARAKEKFPTVWGRLQFEVKEARA